ncbi:MAG: DEAD/DEAH box helicase [Cyanobacteria bacterium J06626_23]
MTSTITTFEQLELAPPILQAIDQVGYETPSPIQAKSIPALLEGRDILGQAQTGTGKTAAYALPLLSQLDLSRTEPQILVLTPTRELAIQVAESMQTYARYLDGFHIAPVYGGQSISTQLRQLRRGVHAVVGTPGRILDHLGRGTLKLGNLSTVVLDEADEMLRMGFIEDVETILEKTPETRQVALFSATMPKAVQRVANRHLHEPIEIRIKAKTATVSTVTQRYWQGSGMDKLDALTRILEVEDFDAMLVFVRTKLATADLAEKLEARGYSSAMLNGDINQNLREKTVERLKKGSLDIVVATDVAARGLDVERISHVVNYDVPYDTETYVHRIGRTGRAGRSGQAILFISPREKRMLRTIERATRQPIEPMQLPSQADIADRRVTQFKQLVTDTIESENLTFFEDLIERYQQEQDLEITEIAAALAFLAQKERPLRPKAEKRSKKSDRPKLARSGDWPMEKGKHSVGSMQCYRMDVGRMHRVGPKDIVGAIANEANLESRYIGEIQIFDEFSTVDLPAGMPSDVLAHLKSIKICNRPAQLTPCEKPHKPPYAKRKRSKKTGPGASKGHRRVKHS